MNYTKATAAAAIARELKGFPSIVSTHLRIYGPNSVSISYRTFCKSPDYNADEYGDTDLMRVDDEEVKRLNDGESVFNIACEWLETIASTTEY